MKIVNGKGKMVGDVLLNASKRCAAVDMLKVDTSAICCGTDMPEMRGVMQSEHAAVWQKHGHIHMPKSGVHGTRRGQGKSMCSRHKWVEML